jgi:hypothetical protein
MQTGTPQAAIQSGAQGVPLEPMPRYLIGITREHAHSQSAARRALAWYSECHQGNLIQAVADLAGQ